jgi:hypothetical protein
MAKVILTSKELECLEINGPYLIYCLGTWSFSLVVRFACDVMQDIYKGLLELESIATCESQFISNHF